MNVTEGARTFRPEIQGVRAIAVIAVLIFHLWPSILPGGYVGVDVFFVVSGFLITGLLLRQVERTGRIQVLDFYAKRIKRLLPAATLVLVAVGICVSLLPILRWADTANEIAASALYVENWWLAAKAVDYLAAEAAPSPLQHFWSLSVEEQYYIAWPLIFSVLGAFGLLQRFGPRRAFGVAIVVIGLVSLVYSIYITPRNPGLAYFATTTRAWELALGGALAVFTGWERIPEHVRRFLGIIGLVMVVVAVITFSGETAFPGYAAALPTVGAALLIISGDSRSAWSVFSILKSKPFQYIGDLSYSLYLWHWPVVVFYAQIAAREIGLVDGVVIASISLALAHQTKELVEDRFRSRQFASSAQWKPFGLGAMCISLPLICWLCISYQVSRHSADTRPESRAVEFVKTTENQALGNERVGSRQCPTVEACLTSFKPSLAVVSKDVPSAYKEGCHVGLRAEEPQGCLMGRADGQIRMFVAGDSHAAQWLPAYKILGESLNWRVESFTKSACSFSDVTVLGGVSGGDYLACRIWGERLLEHIRDERPDYILISQSVAYRVSGLDRGETFEVLVAAYESQIRKIKEMGVTPIILADTPRLGINVPECLAASGATFEGCSRNARPLLSREDPLVSAANMTGEVVVSLNDLICTSDKCAPVEDGVLIWRDSHHVTATFSRKIGADLADRISSALQ